MSNINECCESVNLNFRGPLVEVIKDEFVISEFIAKLQLIPKFQVDSTSSLSFLEYIKTQCTENPTLGNSKKGINRLSFDGEIDVKYSETPNLKSRGRVLSENDFDDFENAVNDIGLSLSKLADATKTLNDSMIDTGDSYLYLSVEKIGTLWKTNIEAIEYTDFMYYAEKRNFGIPQYGVWCKNWTPRAIEEDDFKFLRVTQAGDAINWSVSKVQTRFETIIHFKNSSGRLYGKFDLATVFRQILTENKETEKLLKVSSASMTGLGALFLPNTPNTARLVDEKGKELPKGADIKAIKAAFDKNATNNGENPSEMVIAGYNPENGKPELINFNFHRDFVWTEGIDKMTTSKIYQYLQWSKTIGGGEQVRGGLGSNTEVNELLKINALTILPTQAIWEMRWSSIFNSISALTGKDIFKRCTVKFERKVDTLINQYKILNSNVTATSTDNGDGGQGV